MHTCCVYCACLRFCLPLTARFNKTSILEAFNPQHQTNRSLVGGGHMKNIVNMIFCSFQLLQVNRRVVVTKLDRFQTLKVTMLVGNGYCLKLSCFRLLLGCWQRAILINAWWLVHKAVFPLRSLNLFVLEFIFVCACVIVPCGFFSLGASLLVFFIPYLCLF